MPERAPVPCVVTIHDCTFFDHPEWHVRSKALLFRRAIRRAALHAAALVCVSEVTATRLRACCEVRAPIVVAPHGVDHDRFTPDRARRRVPIGPSSRRAGVPARPPAGRLRGHAGAPQGRGALVAAFDRVADAHRDAVLVLCGQSGWGLAETERALAAARHADRILRVGLPARRGGSGPAAPGHRGGLPGAGGGLRPAGPRGPGLRRPADHHRGHGDGRSGAGTRPIWSARAMTPRWPMPWGSALEPREGRRPRSQRRRALGLAVAAQFTWAVERGAARRGVSRWRSRASQ